METMITLEKIEEYFKTHKNGEIYRHVIDDLEKILIEKALEHSFGNQLTASKILGLNRNTLRTKIRKLNIQLAPFRQNRINNFSKSGIEVEHDK